MDAAPAHMQRAIRLARRGLGHVEPNPIVGCVIVNDEGVVVGEGWHRRFGGPHAEVEALAAAGEQARGATVYVTLEPCPHFGKTPPCDRALIAAGVKRVVIGCLDPNPGRSGLGVAHLEAAGVETVIMRGEMHAACLDLIEPFMKRTLIGLPYVIAKWAMTADGSIATARGDSQWISDENSRRAAHQLRARVDAIIVGIGTALADDPLLTARGVKRRRIARRVVIDPSLKLPVESKLVRSAGEVPLTIVVAEAALTREGEKAAALRECGVELFSLPGAGRADPDASASLRDVSASGLGPGGAGGVQLDVEQLLRHLVSTHGATNVMVEGGGRTVGALAEQGLIDEWWVFIGPLVLGDAAGVRPVMSSRPPERMAGAWPLRLSGLRRIGHDVLAIYRTRRAPGSSDHAL